MGFRFGSILRSVALLGALCLPMIAGLGLADEPPKEAPADKKAVTVPTGTPMMVKTGSEVSSKDKAGRKFSATLEANLTTRETIPMNARTTGILPRRRRVDGMRRPHSRPRNLRVDRSSGRPFRALRGLERSRFRSRRTLALLRAGSRTLHL